MDSDMNYFERVSEEGSNCISILQPLNFLIICSAEYINGKATLGRLKAGFAPKCMKMVHLLSTENSLWNLFQIFWKSLGIGLFLKNDYINTLAGGIDLYVQNISSHPFILTLWVSVKQSSNYFICPVLGGMWHLTVSPSLEEHTPPFYFIRIVSGGGGYKSSGRAHA